MPTLTPSELLQLHEIAMEHATSIAKLYGYEQFVQDPELSAMLDHDRRKSETHYQEIIEMARGDASSRAQLDGGLEPSQRGRGFNSATRPVQPKPQQGFSDRTIAQDCLSCNKQMAVRSMFAATECSHVGLRRALSEMARYHLDAAFEFYRFMEHKGWYSPLKANENPEHWFEQTHEPMSQGQWGERGDWATASGMPS